MTQIPPPPPLGPAIGAPGSRLQRIGGLGTALVVLLAIHIPLQVVGLFDTVRVANKASDYLDGVISEEQFRDSLNGLGNLAGLLVIPIAVLTMIWMFRMASNLRVLGRVDATWTPGWAIGAWFCPPCVVYAIPWLMFRELWKGSDPDVAPFDPSWKQGRVPALVNVWWVLYGLVPLLGIVSAAGMFSRVGNTGDETRLAERIDDFVGLNLVLAAVGVGTTVVYLLLVRGLTARHRAATLEV